MAQKLVDRKAEPKDTTMLLRLSKRERARLKLKADAAGMSLSAYLRTAGELANPDAVAKAG